MSSKLPPNAYQGRIQEGWRGEAGSALAGRSVYTRLSTVPRQGYECPAIYNPADFFIRTLACTPGSEAASKATVRKICDRFVMSHHCKETIPKVRFLF